MNGPMKAQLLYSFLMGTACRTGLDVVVGESMREQVLHGAEHLLQEPHGVHQAQERRSVTPHTPLIQQRLSEQRRDI